MAEALSDRNGGLAAFFNSLLCGPGQAGRIDALDLIYPHDFNPIAFGGEHQRRLRLGQGHKIGMWD